jgi:LysM repeat protein
MTRRAILIVIGMLVLSTLSLAVYHVKATDELHQLISPTNPATDVPDMLHKINALRQSRGVATLTVNSNLIVAAQEQADYISHTGIYAHVHADGSSPESRALAAGYQTTEWCCSENTHRTQVGKSAWEFWNYSVPHYNNMINPKWTEIGIARSTVASWTGYVMVFGSGIQGELPAQQPEAPVEIANAPQDTVPQSNAAAPAASTASGQTYRVNWGDSLSAIAGRYGVTIRDLASANNISGDLIFAGQTLVIPNGQAAPPAAAPQQPQQPAAQPQQVAQDGYTPVQNQTISLETGEQTELAKPATASGAAHRVVWGDTLLKISQRYSVSVDSIMTANNIDNRHLIFSGQTLVIPEA